MRRVSSLTLVWLAAIGCTGLLHFPTATWAQPPAKDGPKPIVMREVLVLDPVHKSGRSPVYLDYLVAAKLAGKWKAPKEGESFPMPPKLQRAWKKLSAGKDDWFTGKALMGGYAYWSEDSDKEEVRLLEAQGHLMVYVNGEPRVGDVYSHGYVKVPVLLKKGKNEFLFHAGRGKLQARLAPIKSDVFFNASDMLVPDFRQGEGGEKWGSVVIINASQQPIADLEIQVEGKGSPLKSTPVRSLPGLSVNKLGFLIPAGDTKETGEMKVEIKLLKKSEAKSPLDSVSITLHVRKKSDSYKQTFVSKIDGSVQYYGVLPAVPPAEPGLNAVSSPISLVLTLHGASVEGIGQANAYGSKTWAHIVAPTNRRPFGFDWEDWGRKDAIEVLEHAQKTLGTDPSRTYLTGHSMGGHGVWHVGATYPDRFAAIGPSAGWVTFWTYGGKKWSDDNNPVYALVDRASNPSDTFALSRNFLQQGVYILHGESDDNVPVSQARMMKSHLSAFHHDLSYFEQPKAGHWWDAHPEPGTDCVDWAPMFDFFARHVIPYSGAVRHVEFVTMNPGISARSHWVTIEAQQRAMAPSSVKVKCDPGLRQFSGTTDNVARIAFDLKHLGGEKPLQVELDGQKIKDIPWPKAGEGHIWLERKGDKWAVAKEPAKSLKGPHRYGPFREAFQNNMLFVYGTKGTPEENAWAFNKARFDAENFWYQGNGSIEYIADKDFDADQNKDRNVILYGNADTNAAWKALLGKSEVQVQRGEVHIGQKKFTGQGLACFFVQPRPGSDVASVGVVSGTGLAGMQLSDRLKIFVSGAGYPDLMLYGPEMLTKDWGGVRAAGFFGLDWSVANGEFVYGK